MKTSTALVDSVTGPASNNFFLSRECSTHDLALWHAFQELSKKAAEHDPPQLSATEHAVPPHTNICHPTTWSDVVPVISTGWAASMVALPDGRQQILSFLLPGDVASAALMLGPTAGRLVQSITRVSFRAYSRAELKLALTRHPELFEKFSKVWIAERTEADQLAIDLGRRTADERLARLILKLAKRLAERGLVQGETFDFPLRQHQVADATGLTPVHVSRVLGNFRRKGLIEIDGRLLTILNADALSGIAGLM
jgi:CRP-like cAMP-binding protein